MKTALITGITGQDGSYLAEYLLSKGYEVHGIIRRASSTNTSRINHIKDRLHLHYGDLADSETISSVINKHNFDEVYNMAAQSHVKISFESPEYTSNITALGASRLLESIHQNSPDTKFLQASSSEMFGSAAPPQNEHTLFDPQSPYAVSKLFAYHSVKNYRNGYNIFAVNSIAFNHESPRRGEMFVTRKITMGIADIIAGKEKYLSLGNINAKRDWGFAPEYVATMYEMMQQDRADDYVIGTGITATINEFLDVAFSYCGLDITKHLHIDPELYRPNEVRVLQADASYARKKLEFNPRIKTFEQLAKIMMDSDMRRIGLPVIGEGDEIIAKQFPGKEKWWIGD